MSTDKKIPHEKQKIQGKEKQDMDDRFRESLRDIRKIIKQLMDKK